MLSSDRVLMGAPLRPTIVPELVASWATGHRPGRSPAQRLAAPAICPAMNEVCSGGILLREDNKKDRFHASRSRGIAARCWLCLGL